MNADKDEIRQLFNEVEQQITQNVRQMMEELWLNWSHLGVDDATKVNNITKLVQIEKELHRDVISETRQKLKSMQAQVDKLKEETEELSRCLSVDITILEFKEDMLLVVYKRELENQIAGYREQVEQRRMKMERLQEWQRDLVEKLGVAIGELRDMPLPSEEELEKLKDQLEVLQAERDKRAEIFLTTQVEIKDIMEKLQIKPQNKFENLVITSLSVDFKVTDHNMDRLAKLLQDLQEKYQQTNNRVLELRERLTKLWDCLEEDRIYRENFLQAHPGCHPHTENAIKEEIRRCDQIKRQKIQVFVANVRTKIKLMWDNIMYSTKEREEFLHYYQDIFSEDTLALHELYLEKITKFYNDHKDIFEMVMTRKNLWLKMTELEARATEPGRYHNRGGQLLKEEKERKVIASNLPKIEAKIRELVLEYEARTGKIFTVDGKPLLQLMQEDWETRKAERQNKLSARKQALTPNTPLFSSMATSPLGKRNRTAAGLAATTEKRLPAKRQLITGSATKAVSSLANNLSAFKRSAISTVKRRLSGRLAARAVAEGKGDHAKRKLDYGGEQKKTPKICVNASILKHKRTSHGRRSTGRRSINKTRSTTDTQEEGEEKEPITKDPLMETTLLTTYTEFKDRINEKQISRSSLATKTQEMNMPVIFISETIAEKKTPMNTPKKTPRNKIPSTLTPLKVGKENMHSSQYINNVMTPKSSICTPSKLTRSALKLTNEGFATPRTPLSGNKVNLQRQNTVTAMHLKTTPNNVSRSKTTSHLVRVKNLPPLI
ncbi:protein regulator of cytokinesis 1-like [Battus philenor]|uniref:protein regulator of cytokinesis 1-like n=1 Tax=Battus philenor TaxID=42288 RepID=UPI0035CF870F